MNEKSQTRSISSLHSIGSHKDREYDTIPFRIDFIKDLLHGKRLEPMVDLTNPETENFINQQKSSNDDNISKDTGQILNKKLHNFYKVISQIGGKLLYIKSGTSGHTFKGTIKGEDGLNVNYAVKVVAYPKRERYGDMNDIDRPENAELMMIKLLSYFVVNKQTPHIVLPIGTFNTNIEPFLNLIKNNVVDKNNKKYLEFVKRYNEKKEYHDYVSILISEWANRGDLLDFIRKNYMEFTPTHWKVFFFQIISVLAVIQSKYPSFRHNDLKANNILVHKVSHRNSILRYTIHKKQYMVPRIGYLIKLWDFDFACIPNVVNNAKVSAKWTDSINVKPEKNRYYDMHYFFNTLIKKGFFPQFMEEDYIPQEAKDFVNRIVPLKFQRGKYVHERGRLNVNVEYLTPDEILRKDPYFEEFRNKNIVKNHKFRKSKNIVHQNEIDKLLISDNKIKKKKYFKL